jgi:hypothetical protein
LSVGFLVFQNSKPTLKYSIPLLKIQHSKLETIMIGGDMFMNMLKGLASDKGVDFVMNKLPVHIQSFITKTGITDKLRLKRLFDGKPLDSDIHQVSENTLTLLAPYIIEAITHISKEVGMQVVFCLVVRDGEIVVKIIQDNIETLEIDGGSFPFKYLVTAILSKIEEAKCEIITEPKMIVSTQNTIENEN